MFFESIVVADIAEVVAPVGVGVSNFESRAVTECQVDALVEKAVVPARNLRTSILKRRDMWE